MSENRKGTFTFRRKRAWGRSNAKNIFSATLLPHINRLAGGEEPDGGKGKTQTLGVNAKSFVYFLKARRLEFLGFN